MKEIEKFIEIADIGLIRAVQSVCRSKYPNTVKAFDALNDSEIAAIRRGGLKSLPQTKIAEIAKAMETDSFVFSI